MDIQQWMTKIDEKLDHVLENQTKTNERLLKVEIWKDSIDDWKNKQSNRSWDIWKSIGVGAVLLIFAGLFGWFIKSQQDKPADNIKLLEILEKINDKLDKK